MVAVLFWWNAGTKRRNFWRPPIWKWLVVVSLLIVAILLDGRSPLFRKSPQVQSETTPVRNVPTQWDGSYPVVVVKIISGTSHKPKLEDSISSRTLSVQHNDPVNQFEVDLRSGMFVLRQSDFFVPAAIPLNLVRTFRPWDEESRAFGIGANHPYDICPVGTRNPYTYIDLYLEDGNPIHFDRVSKGVGYADAVYKHYGSSPEFNEAKIEWNGNGWRLRFNDGSAYTFPEAYYAKNFAQGAPIEIQDAKGNRLVMHRDAERNLKQIESSPGRQIVFDYDKAARIIKATDNLGDIREYSYDNSGHLVSVSDQNGILYRFSYERDEMTAIFDHAGNPIVQNRYRDGRIFEEKLFNGKMYRYDYLQGAGDVGDTIVMLPNGKSKQFIFESNGKLFNTQ